LGIVAHTRKPRSEERASGRALLSFLAGSYVFGSVPRTVFVMQAASDDAEDKRIVSTCCKTTENSAHDRPASGEMACSYPDADSDESGHLFQSISDSIPIYSDSCRSEATLVVCHKGVSE